MVLKPKLKRHEFGLQLKGLRVGKMAAGIKEWKENIIRQYVDDMFPVAYSID